MSDRTQSDLDPRFDPAFQRGFDPATAPQQTAPRMNPRVAAPPAPAAAAAPVSAPPVARPPAPPANRVTTSAVVDDHAVLSGHELDAADLDAAHPQARLSDTPSTGFSPDAATGRNPFLIVLGIVAVILVAVGIWLFMQAGVAFNSRAIRSQGDYTSLQATLTVAPFISLLGVATAIGVVFVFAARWRRRG
jgi:hypothetical protein